MKSPKSLASGSVNHHSSPGADWDRKPSLGEWAHRAKRLIKVRRLLLEATSGEART